ncbi:MULTISPECIES: flagellar hook-basal body complex protein FliE [Methylobacillus]|uniref:Flagellar hook-basal body complex protein FliE n=1 Tax=Methylobacillus flagellatus (strain ATCC 51484 / DSM 6875 / VKM B-1610 / KT) TaxID=265072 RepID=Q1GZU1_METFK|nr:MULTISPECIES: flagellar hook-basal body complex protein FliE [Methylobacillus]ABE50246.1 flagellar hook-basal body complex protein (FliE) [Methylobacillus flagellatus KT]MPS48413.1 flagellar hook-basal body complex protein FliE [Methylobacillus sp.]
MKTSAIDSGRIEAMLAQLKAAAQKPATDTAMHGISGNSPAQKPQASNRVDFADVLKSSISQVNQAQVKAEELGQSFAMGDDKVSLSDVMVAGQKANISLQATIQVRNRLVSAYQDIMNMQV